MIPVEHVARFWLLILLGCLSVCGCKAPIVVVPTTDWSQTPGLVTNARCSVSVRGKESEKFLYDGTIESFDASGVTLSDATLFHTVVTRLPVVGYLPVVGRIFAMEGETAQTLPHVTLKYSEILNLTVLDSQSNHQNPEQQHSSSDGAIR
ncbi:hypothetical protein SAMN05421753_112189 [Planctomicrobium piriforme]|uniref:Uncharacterized protein n=1 Tax=Planctomicrobium piriforme TaxID=1576369 RepID=A0A1I3L9L7_9PLAN|nr:hypothetical protein SAMN05421753_112189 [Planctomicrobium piriforme]